MDNIFQALDLATGDTAAGINIAKMAGDEHFSMYCTRMEPGRHVNAHFHESGMELYHIVRGSGLMCTGYPIDKTRVDWCTPFPVIEGDVITVLPGQAHQIENNSNDSLIVVFVCSPSHLGEDRKMMEGILGR